MTSLCMRVCVRAADVARHVLRHEGGPPGLFKGMGATLLRESLGNMGMFGVYETVKQQMVTHKVGWHRHGRRGLQ